MISPEPLVSSESLTAVDASESIVTLSGLLPTGVTVRFSLAWNNGLKSGFLNYLPLSVIEK